MSEHHHAHGHSHHAQKQSHAHDHSHAQGADERRLLIAFALTSVFMVAEVVGGFLSGSLALIADAGHMATDAAALALAWFSTRLARKPATVLRSYGYHRAQILAAFINGSALIGLSIWIVIEAAHRFLAPVAVLGAPMMIVAGLGLAINVAVFLVLQDGSRENLNLRGAVLHVISDMFGSAAALAAAAVILFTGWTPIDPLLSIIVSLLIVRSAWRLVTRSWHVLMEGAPEGFDVEAVIADLKAAAPGVTDIHHVHVWALTPEKPLITLHARLDEGADSEEALHRLHHALRERAGLTHATIQIERGPCPESAAPAGVHESAHTGRR
jgi:cobalt-zinc-cadmium efflux system protein